MGRGTAHRGAIIAAVTYIVVCTAVVVYSLLGIESLAHRDYGDPVGYALLASISSFPMGVVLSIALIHLSEDLAAGWLGSASLIVGIVLNGLIIYFAVSRRGQQRAGRRWVDN